MYMSKRIDSDRSRFKKIVRGAVRSGIRKYLSRGELIGRRGKDLVSIPLPELEIPRFRFGRASQGVGQGEGNPGDPIAVDPDAGGTGEAGSDGSPDKLAWLEAEAFLAWFEARRPKAFARYQAHLRKKHARGEEEELLRVKRPLAKARRRAPQPRRAEAGRTR